MLQLIETNTATDNTVKVDAKFSAKIEQAKQTKTPDGKTGGKGCGFKLNMEALPRLANI